MNPTKLGLHFADFSVIFYAIYKNQENHFTIGVTQLQEGPRNCCFAMWPLGAAGRCGWGKFLRGSPEFGRGRAGGGGSIWELGR
jgi:hypothetical protein